MDVTECENCGGLVVFDADTEAVKCVFCGDVSLTAAELSVGVQPTHAVPFVVSSEDATARFRAWARRAFWAPRGLADRAAELERVWIPAWRVRARVHATWTGLVSARTKSGKRPKAGLDVSEREVWVPGSLGLTQAELSALAPFSEAQQLPWDPSRAEAPYEVGGLTSEGAIAAARSHFRSLASAALARAEGLEDPRVSVLLEDVVAVPWMLPVWVGCVRFRDRPWRFVINGQNGRTTGRAPIDRRKILLAVTLAVAVVVWLVGCTPRVEPFVPAPAVSQASTSTALEAAASLEAVLEGDRTRFDEAVAQLYANRGSSQSKRSLARLLNLPLSEGKLEYARLQRTLYAELLSEAPLTERDAEIARGFLLAATAADQYREGHRLRALRTLETLERELQAAVERTDDVDLHAMLGNYAHQSGGLIPLRRGRRFELAREHLAEVVMRFDELSPEARGVATGVPGVHAVFAMWWAELLRREGDPKAQAAYVRVGEISRASEDTPALRTLAEVATTPSGDEGPLWPSGYDSCIACHSRTSKPRRP